MAICQLLIASCQLRQPQANQPFRIEIRPLPSYGYVKMWTGGASGAAAQADFLAAFHLISLFYFEFREMQIKRKQTLAVVQHHEIAFEIQRPRQQHSAIIHSRHGSATGDAKIQSQVRTRGLAIIEDSLRAENV